MGKYDDIIRLPHPVSRVGRSMGREERAAQFSPFSALTGLDSAVQEAGRLTEERIELDEYEKEAVNRSLLLLREKLGERPEVFLSWYRPDGRKKGGSYPSCSGTVRKIDEGEGLLILESGEKIPLENIVVLSF